ncbi:MAG TPA: CHAP domain-containing protein [bacterium]|nr:CHAP domain-containing protein [bacterium]HPS28728.1 CHAP domain-containing protein [bacterium]
MKRDKMEYKEYIENAIEWAKKHIGVEEYKYQCLGFVEDCYEQGNNVEIFGGDTAKESADFYEANKNKETPPPVGSFVFYDSSGNINGIYKNWGHVGICIGDGKIVHTWNVIREDNYLDVQNLKPGSGWNQPQYIGWAPVERIFQGYRKK